MEKIYIRTNWLEYFNLDEALGYFIKHTNSWGLPYHNVTHASEVLYHTMCIISRETSYSDLEFTSLGIAAIFHNANYIPIDRNLSLTCCSDFLQVQENNIFVQELPLDILKCYYEGTPHDLANMLHDANTCYLIDSQSLPQQVLGKYYEMIRPYQTLSIENYIDQVISEYEYYNDKGEYHNGYCYDLWDHHKDTFKDRLLKLKKSLK